MAKKKKHSISTTEKVGIGIGITAAVLGAAGGYFLYGSKDASKNRKKVKSWMLKAKAEVLEGIEKAQHMTEDEYQEMVEKVGKTYGKLKDASGRDLADFKKEMFGHWQRLEKVGKRAGKKVAKRVKKAKKKAPKRSGKRTTKKTARKATKKTVRKAAKKRT